jgi:hypothetical protein
VSLYAGAIKVFGAAGARNWSAASSTTRSLASAWNRVRAGEVPRRLVARTNSALAVLGQAVTGRSRRHAQLAALDVARAAIDVELRYRPAAEVDAARFGLWTRELQADAAARDRAAAMGDVATLQWIADRLSLGSSDTALLRARLRSIQAAVRERRLAAAATAAAGLAPNR